MCIVRTSQDNTSVEGTIVCHNAQVRTFRASREVGEPGVTIVGTDGDVGFTNNQDLRNIIGWLHKYHPNLVGTVDQF